ncbi:squalene synthase HpnC [Phycisphaerae bacterium]|nr:squalene synthase HpnC [Phycisphaerae bacterium]
MLSHARAHVRRITRASGENFTVLSRLVPGDLRDDYAAVYAFCRVADDAADEHSNDAASREASLRTLCAMRAKLIACERGELGRGGGALRDDDLLFVALQQSIAKRKLPVQAFHDLLDAFEQDQRVTRYETWDDVMAYSRKSANPVGRLVLALHGEAMDESARAREMLRCSDCICTALQLTNFWQDVRRDLLERDRVYLPAESGMPADKLREWMGKPKDTGVRRRMTDEMRELCRRTSELYRQGKPLEQMVEPRLAWILWLFRQGGQRTLQLVEEGGYVTLWERPRVGKVARAGLLLRAYWGAVWGVLPSATSE